MLNSETIWTYTSLLCVLPLLYLEPDALLWCFWKASCRVVWCFFEQSCWKQLSDDLQDCLQWPLFKELKHRFFSSAKLNTYCIWRICVGCHIKYIYYCQFCVNMFFFSVLIFLQFMPYWKCASLNVSILPWSQFSKSISVDSFVFLEVE